MSDARDTDVLDPEVIDSLRSLGRDGDPGLLGDLVRLFLGDSSSALRAVREGLLAGDAKQVERSAHSLKSSSANLGALRLSRLLAEIESAGRSGELGRAQAVIESAERELGEAEDALRKLVQS